MSKSDGRVMLEVFGTKETDTSRFVLDEPRIQVGRSSSMDLTVSNEVVSSHHLTFQWSGDQLRVRDESSTNGTVLNGHRLTPGTPVPVEAGDDITVESVRLHVASLTPPTPSAENADLTMSESGALSAFQEMFSGEPTETPSPTRLSQTGSKQAAKRRSQQPDTDQNETSERQTTESLMPTVNLASAKKTLLLATVALAIATGLAVVAFILRGALAG